ncbi:MAG: hypothetical protein AB1726_02750 [Planctomycetota bacterium]
MRQGASKRLEQGFLLSLCVQEECSMGKLLRGGDDRRRPSLSLLGWLVAASLAIGALPHAGGRSGREGETGWNQHRGDAAATATSSFRAIRSTPGEEWRHDFGAILAEPVSWGGVVYAAVKEGPQRKLVAFRASGGERLASAVLGGKGPVGLAVWQGTAIVVAEDEIVTYAYAANRLAFRKRLKGKWDGPPSVHEGLLFLAGGGELSCIDLERLSVVGTAEAGGGRVSVCPAGGGDAILSSCGVASPPRLRGTYLALHLARLTGIGTKEVSLRHERSQILTMVDERAAISAGYVARWADEDHGVEGWLVHSPVGLRSSGKGTYYTVLPQSEEGCWLSPIVTDAVVWERLVLGFSADSELVAFETGGRYRVFVSAADMPAGARPGPATIASGVAYLGNWAVDLADSRVLWCRADLRPATPLLPLADDRVVYATADGALVGLVDPNAPAEAPADAGGEAGALPPPRRPDDGEVVILADGRVLPRGAPEPPPEEIAFRGNEAGFTVTGEEHPLFLAWRNALHAELVGEIEATFRSYAKVRLFDECRRLLAEAKDYGLDSRQATTLEGLLAGKPANQSGNVEDQRRRIRAEEDERREKVRSSFVAAADWCRERGQRGAATVLYSHARHVRRGGENADVIEAAAALAPAEFPWRAEKDAAERWMAWTEELLPAAASFCGREDPDWKRLEESWPADAIALRTKNLLVFSQAPDAALLGRCLRKGEGSMRAVGEILGVAAAPEEERLQVRIYTDREAYQAALGEKGDAADWSAGLFSPAENVSRFFVPRGKDGDPLARSLDGVLAHELTHHYLFRRWMGGRQALDPDQPGFWVVEGIAEFVSDQFLELGRAERRFDDPTVLSLDVAARLAETDSLLPLAALLDLSPRAFQGLSGEGGPRVRPRYTLAAGEVEISPRHAFYCEAAALAFLLWNRRGEEGRAAFLRALRDHYEGRTAAEGWKALGWESAAAAEAELRAFLRGVAR